MKLLELIKIDNRFEKSVNLTLDLYVQDKIDGYIPTRSSVNILDSYINEVRSFSGNRATVLIGPYGKGKSHLLLVLLSILSQTCQMSAIKKLVQRISAVNPDAASHISDVMENQGQFLPVLINASGNNSLNQAFMRGLTSALVRDGLDDVIPDNYYTESVKMLLNWQQNFPDTYKLFQRKLNKETIDSFIKKLESYDEKALEFFRAVYPELTSGGMFNPLIDNEVISVYQSVNRILREKHGYAGIYIIFDEFSKYIEGHAVEGFADDMKILQDMCELCNASKDEQLHLTCVAHKSIKTYGAALSAEILNSFKGVEGRLKEVYFVVSSQNNYELISDAISKTPAFDSWAKGNQLYADLIEKSYALKAFSSLFTPGDYNEIVGKGCFPLTPVAAMLLLNLSEKIAQNERTIFTYIASKDANGLARHVEKSKNDKFVGVDSVYDYFVPLFKEEVQVGIHHEWLKADYALSQIKTAVEAAVIKSIAVIRMINNADEITASEKFITLATGLNKADIQIALAHLSDRKLIEFKARTGAYEFKNNVGVDIEQAIADCMKKRFSKADPCSVLANVVKERYILPKKHNQTFCMTRYFNFAYMTYAQYMNLKDLSYLTWPNRPDGVIVMMMPSEEIDRAAVEAHTKEISDPCLITCLPNVSVTCDEIAKYYLAVSSLHNNSTFIEDNLVIKKELEKLAEETIIALNEWVKNTYYPLQNIYSMDGPIAIGPKGLNRLVSDICDTAYHFTPRINHELINRHEVTAQVAKARNTILDELLNGKDVSKYDNGTSAESTIFRAVMIHTQSDENMRRVRAELEQFFASCVNQKKSFDIIITRLTRAPYGMRLGVLPFYILDSLLRLENMPIIYLNKKEVVLDLETVNNIVKHPKDYSLYVELETVQKAEYVHALETLFSDYSEYCREVDKKNRLAKISCMMQSWYRSLPQTSKTFEDPDRDDQDIKSIIAFRKLFTDIYLNPREIIFERLPKIFKSTATTDTIAAVQVVKNEIDSHIHFVRETAIKIIRDTFGFAEETNLQQSLLTWYDNLPEVAKNSIFSARVSSLIEYIQAVDTGDTDDIASKIVRKTTGMFIEDWKSGFESKFKDELKEAVDEVLSKKENAVDTSQKILLMSDDGTSVERFYDFDAENLSATATFFRNALEDVMEEYDGILENNEKIGVLMDAIKKLMT